MPEDWTWWGFLRAMLLFVIPVMSVGPVTAWFDGWEQLWVLPIVVGYGLVAGTALGLGSRWWRRRHHEHAD